MKTNFTFTPFFKPFWYLLLCFALTTINTIAQTKHTIEVGNYYFSPRQLEIEAGDTVEWINVEGDHYINGSLLAYPNNPESFESDDEDGTALWPLVHVFYSVGTYHYRCEAHQADHRGEIIVTEVTNVSANETGKMNVFPNPATDKFWLYTGNYNPRETELSLFDITGKLHHVEQKIQNNKIEFNISNLKQGIYLLELKIPDDRKMFKLIKK